MEDSDVGNRGMILGLNMLNGFPGNMTFFFFLFLNVFLVRFIIVGQTLILNPFVIGASTFCKKRDKSLFIRSKPDFQDCLNRYVKTKKTKNPVLTFLTARDQPWFLILSLQLLNNGDSREFVDPPGKYGTYYTMFK